MPKLKFVKMFRVLSVLEFLFILTITFSLILAYEDPILSKTIKWIPSTETDVSFLPQAGKGQGRWPENYYIGRTNYLGGVIPGKVYGNNKGIMFGFEGKELSNPTYEVLIYPMGALSWVEVINSTEKLPEKLFRGGTEPTTGEPLYICRWWFDEHGLLIGKLEESTKLCYIPGLGEERKYEHFEALIVNNISTCSSGSGIVSTIMIVLLVIFIVLVSILLGLLFHRRNTLSKFLETRWSNAATIL